MKKIVILILFILSTLISYSQDGTNGGVFFPHPENGYRWQSAHNDVDVLVGISIANAPNDIGNYRYDIYMTSKTVEDSLVVNIVVGEILIELFNIKKTSQVQEEKYDFSVQFKPLTMVITDEANLIYTLFLPEKEGEIVVSWGYIKKLKK